MHLHPIQPSRPGGKHATRIAIHQSESNTGSSQIHKDWCRRRRFEGQTYSSMFSASPSHMIRLLKLDGFAETLEWFSCTEATASRKYSGSARFHSRFWATSSDGFPLDTQWLAHHVSWTPFHRIDHRTKAPDRELFLRSAFAGVHCNLSCAKSLQLSATVRGIFNSLWK